MKVLMFNHHPDVLHYMWRGFTELGWEVHIADEELTKDVGFKYSSTKKNKFEVVNQLYEPGQLYPDMKDAKFISIKDLNGSIKGYDIIWSMMPDIKHLEIQYGIKTWFDVQMQAFLRDPRVGDLPGIKSANHPNAYLINKIDFCANWVSEQPALKERKFITQLVTEAHLVNTTPELIALQKMGYPVRIHGGDKTPDGFIKDTEILPLTAMLVHNKQFGVNCYAVCKALDTGIPVFMSRETRSMIGFSDLPDSVFLFSDDYTSIDKAYEKALTLDPVAIQAEYRKVYTLDRTLKCMKYILNKHGF